MNRRDVIKAGAIATAGALAPSTACVSIQRSLGALSGADGAAEFNKILDEELANLAKPGLLQKLVVKHTKKPLSAKADAAIAQQDAMFRQMLSTLLVSQGFRDLPPETQVQPEVQDRMWRHYDEIGSSVFQISDMLSSLDEATRAAVRTKLKEDPELPMSIGQALHDSATKAGMSTRRKGQLRAMMAQSQFRLQHADPGTVIHEYVTKVERHRASSERDADALDLARQIGEREFWRYKHLLAFADDPSGAPGATAPVPAPAPTPAPAPPIAPPAPAGDPVARTLYQSAIRAARQGRCQDVAILGNKVRDVDPAFYAEVFAINPEIVNCNPNNAPGVAAPAPPPPAMSQPYADPDRPKPGDRGIRAGGYMLGIGLIFGAIGALLVAAEVFAGVFALTIAVVLFGIGLIVLLISALIRATADDTD